MEIYNLKNMPSVLEKSALKSGHGFVPGSVWEHFGYKKMYWFLIFNC